MDNRNYEQMSDNSKVRWREILSVLNRNHITKGLTPERLRMILEDLGPTYVKLGQIMSMRSDILPERYCDELIKLRTDVRPFPFEQVIEVVEQELKRKYTEIFFSIDPIPSGSASIAQVHNALLCSGKEVVVKVQRPNIREKMADDIVLLRKAVGILKITIGSGDLIDFRMVVDELWKTAQEEMNFLSEASNLKRFYKNQKEIVYVTCPQVVDEFTTEKILVMERIKGIQIDHIKELTELGYDMTEIGQKTAENYCKQILEDGFFHADPHPGNLWIAGGKIAWLDLGMVGSLSEQNRELLKKAIRAILKNDIYELKNVFLAFGEPRERIDHALLYSDIDDIVRRYMSMGFGNMNLGELMERMLDVVKKHHIAMSADITLLGRSMVTIEGLLCACSPDVSLIQVLTTYMSSIIWSEIDFKKELLHNTRLLYTSFGKSLEIPAQLSDLLSIAKNGQFRLNHQLSEGRQWKKFFSRLMMRLVLGMIAAALFVSSSLLCMTNMPGSIEGIPTLAFWGYVSGTVLLVIIILGYFHKPDR